MKDPVKGVFSDNKRVWLLFKLLFIALLIPVYFLNLGVHPLIEDEAIRGLVAQEMNLNGNLITPTLNSEFYYKKPPLFNWFVLLSYKITGEVSAWSLRLPTVNSLILFSLITYLCGRRYLSKGVALLSALAILTNGRILFYDSYLGLIDMSFSLAIFLMFYVIFHYSTQEKWSKMFLCTYLLTAIALMLKGLPALVFLILSLVGFLAFRGQLKRLISRAHFVGILSGLSLIVLYGLSYHWLNPLTELIKTFYNESTKATALEHSFWHSLQHFINFPFELIYHFLPWMLLPLFLLFRSVRNGIRQNQFLVFCAMIISMNIWVYWVSPRVFPRYLFMFLPLFFYLGFEAYWELKLKRSKWIKYLELLLGGAVSIATVLILLAIGRPELELIENSTTILISLAFALSVLLFIYFRYQQYRMFYLVLMLMVGRIGYNVTAQPLKSTTGSKAQVRAETQRLGEKYQDMDLAIIGKEDTYENYSYYMNSFYLLQKRKTAIYRVDRDELKENQFYILDPLLDEKDDYIIHDSIPILHENGHLYIVSILN